MKISKIVVGTLGAIVLVGVIAALAPALRDYFKPVQQAPFTESMLIGSPVSTPSNLPVAPDQTTFVESTPKRLLPFDDNFEGFTSGDPLSKGSNGWYGSSGNVIIVADTNIAPAGSMNMAMIPADGLLSTRFKDVSASKVWIQMDMCWSLYDGTNPQVVDTNMVAMFYVNSNGNFVVHNGQASPDASRSTNWVTLTNFNVMQNGTNWVTIGIYKDFDMKVWDLYANNKLVTNNIKFINRSRKNFAGFDIYNGSTAAYLDNVSVAASNRAVLTVTGSFAVSNKVYDASTAAAISNNKLVLAGTNGGEDVTLEPVAMFTDKNPGKDKTVTLAKSRLAGADAANYKLSLLGAPTSKGDITKANAITVTAANNVKVYDGTTSATGMPKITAGSLVVGDTATWSEVYADKDVGTGKTLTPSGVLNDGKDVSHYSMGVTFVPNHTGVITKQPLAATLVSTISKVYDGNKTAVLGVTNYVLSGLVGSETSAVNQRVGAFATAEVGAGILVTATLAPTNFSESTGGFSRNNYTLPTSAEGTVGEITKAPATVTLRDLAQKYTGQARTVTGTTVPAGLKVVVTYNGSIWDPVNVGNYAVTGAIFDATYQGESTGTLTIAK